MKIISRNNLPDYKLPLSLYSYIHIADAISKEGEEFDVFLGLSKKYVEQLKKLSLDDRDVDLQNYTGDRRRFGEGSYENWYVQNRTIFCLVHKRTDSLAAIAWFGPKTLGKKSIKFNLNINNEHQDEDYWHTASFRSYPSFRGKGMMKNFANFAIDIYKQHFTNIGFWFGTDDRNSVMIKLAQDLGFVIDEENSDLLEHWLILIKK